MIPVIFILLSLQIISVIGVNVKDCNSPLITNDTLNKFRFITPLDLTPIPIIRSDDYFMLEGDLRVVELELTEPHYLTGLTIRVNTDRKSPCNYIESQINLVEYELIINDKRVDIPRRSVIHKTFVKVSFSAIYATKVQIRRVSPLQDPTIYCIQYQLYGCTEEPTNCAPLISYDYTLPNKEDRLYTGECYGDTCSGGLGVLTDLNYDSYLEWNEGVRLSLSFYQQAGISDISLYIISTDSIVTDSQYKRNSMVNGTLVLSINKVLDYIEFSLNSTSSFKIEEILISYWTYGTKQIIDIPCNLVSIPVGLSPQNVAFTVIAVGIFLFIMGLITPFIVWFVRGKNYFRVNRRNGNNLENNNNNNKREEKTQHVYTDIRSQASAAELKPASQFNINGTEIIPEVPITERALSPSLTSTIEAQVKSMSLDRRSKQNSKETLYDLEKCENFMEENSLYQSRSFAKKKEMKRFENLERRDSEVVISENPHYVSSEQMKLTSPTTTTTIKTTPITTTPITTTAPKTEEISYENTKLPKESEEDFVGYDKLNHI